MPNPATQEIRGEVKVISEEKTFQDFIHHHARAHRNPKGDFIKDARTDPRLDGRTFNSWDDLEIFLLTARACHEAICAARLVWRDYRSWLRGSGARMKQDTPRG